MDKLTLERCRNDHPLRAENEAAARRTRARIIKRFLEQAWRALLSVG